MDVRCHSIRVVISLISLPPYPSLITLLHFTMLENLSSYHIILASGSPRRRELLRQLGIDFEVKTLEGIDESYPSHLQGADIAAYISRQKAEAYRQYITSNDLVITADTIVCVDGQVLGKPADSADAAQMLRLLSGRDHEVVTGVTLLSQQHIHTFTAETRVTFAQLTKEEISHYVDHYRPLDKAGAYGIQEWIGMIGVEQIEGSYFNVMGLPVQRLYKALCQIPEKEKQETKK